MDSFNSEHTYVSGLYTRHIHIRRSPTAATILSMLVQLILVHLHLENHKQFKAAISPPSKLELEWLY